MKNNYTKDVCTKINNMTVAADKKSNGLFNPPTKEESAYPIDVVTIKKYVDIIKNRRNSEST